MPRSDVEGLPDSFVLDGIWPHATLKAHAPASAHCAQALARNLAKAIEASGLGLRVLGERAEVSHSTISRMLRGLVLPDIGTLGRLESVLDVPLWPVWGTEATSTGPVARSEFGSTVHRCSDGFRSGPQRLLECGLQPCECADVGQDLAVEDASHR